MCIKERGTEMEMASLEQVIGQFRRMLPEESATAQAIDRKEPWERIARNAVDDGYLTDRSWRQVRVPDRHARNPSFSCATVPLERA
jgi:hypothetical protein